MKYAGTQWKSLDGKRTIRILKDHPDYIQRFHVQKIGPDPRIFYISLEGLERKYELVT